MTFIYGDNQKSMFCERLRFHSNVKTSYDILFVQRLKIRSDTTELKGAREI